MSTEQFPPAIHNNHQRISWLILVLLLLLRIPFVIAIIFLLPIENENGATAYEVSTYLLTAFLMWWERERLVDFHIDSVALFLIILFRPIQTLVLNHWHVNTPLAFPNPYGLMIWAISIGLVIGLWQGGYKPARLTASTLSWLALGIFFGILVSIGENLKSFQQTFGNIQSAQARMLPLLTSTSFNLLYHLGFAPINEEPLFRGFLWGYLRQRKWKDVWIWLFQAGLFTLAHIYYAGQYPLLFWVLIPSTALLLGALAWRSKSIAPGILTHAMVNGSAYLLILALIALSYG